MEPEREVELPVPLEYAWRTDTAPHARPDPLEVLSDDEWADIWDKATSEEGVCPEHPHQPESH